MERVDNTHVCNRVVCDKGKPRAVQHRIGERLRFERVLVDGRYALFTAPVRAGDEEGDLARFGIGNECVERLDRPARTPERVRAFARRAKAAIERCHAAVREAEHTCHRDLDAERFAHVRMRRNPRGLFCEVHACRVHRVAADVHERAAGEIGLKAHVFRIERFEHEIERRAHRA
jgi:hypothetical protein